MVSVLLQYQEQLFQLCPDIGIVINWEKPDLKPSSTVHYLRMVTHTIRERVFLMDSEIVRFWDQTDRSSPPFTSCEDVTAISRPHGLPRTVCSQGLCQDASSSVAAEDALVCSCGQFSDVGPSF